MPALNKFNLGKDSQVSLQGPFGFVDLGLVTRFNARQLTHKVKSNPLNYPPMRADVPDGWEVTFEIDRSNAAADQLMVLIESKFWAPGGSLDVHTLYQYINEVSGAVTTLVYSTGTICLTDAGEWRIDSTVKQRLEGFFSLRGRQ